MTKVRFAAVAALVLLAACNKPSSSSESAPVAKAAAASEHWVSIGKGTPLAEAVKAEAAKARAANKKPILYMGAEWCKPCAALKKYKSDPAMVDAFDGATVIAVDIDDWQSEDFAAVGHKPVAVPIFLALDANGKAT